MNSVIAVGHYYPFLTQGRATRHLHYLPITKAAVVQYVVKLLIIMYWVRHLACLSYLLSYVKDK